jgi:hypothetical protein
MSFIRCYDNDFLLRCQHIFHICFYTIMNIIITRYQSNHPNDNELCWLLYLPTELYVIEKKLYVIISFALFKYYFCHFLIVKDEILLTSNFLFIFSFVTLEYSIFYSSICHYLPPTYSFILAIIIFLSSSNVIILI